jgi:hypothetical protein
LKITIQNGQEYITGWQGRLIHLFTLDDGTKVTVNMVMDRVVNITKTCARARLKTHTNPKIIYRPVRNQVLSSKRRRYNPTSNEIDAHTWYKDPLVKLMLK